MEIEEILFAEPVIARKVDELAAQISRDYAGKELIVISVLRGALVFTADLIRRISVPLLVDFVHASSYGAGTVSSRQINIKKDIEADIAGKHVLVVDCIIDTGETMAFLLKRYGALNPATLRTAVFLDKHSRRAVDVPLDYVGSVIPDKFVVGYGMDCADQHRNLPFVAVVKTTA